MDKISLKTALNMRIHEHIDNTHHNPKVLKEMIDEYIRTPIGGETIPNIKSSAMVIDNNTECLKVTINGVHTNEPALIELTKLYKLEEIGMEYDYNSVLHDLTVFLYQLDYRIPDWVNFNHNRAN